MVLPKPTGAYREVNQKELISSLLTRTPTQVEVDSLPFKVNVRAFVLQRAAILEDKIKRGEINGMSVDQISAQISRELTNMGHDTKTARKLLPLKYKQLKYMHPPSNSKSNR